MISKDYTVMFVCMGNVCRSPLAHVLFEGYLEKVGLAAQVGVESSGVNVYNEGQRVCEHVRKTAACHGTPFDHYSRRFLPQDAEDYDLILAMDEETMYRIKKLVRGRVLKGEIRFFRDFDPAKDNSREVPDPWSGGEREAEEVFFMIERTLPSISAAAENGLGIAPNIC